ncbi:MAG: hypothetical protein RIT43_683 [Bacteroidota bacterium]|jgi:cytoskeletal protein RodZ
MEKECVEIIRSKSFEELSSEELNMLSEWCANKEEFEGLKLVFTGVDILREENHTNNSDKTKASLDQLYAEKHRKRDERKLYPLLMVAAVTIFVFLTYVFWNKKETTYTAREKQDVVNSEKRVKVKKPTNSPKEQEIKKESVLIAENSDSFVYNDPAQKAASGSYEESTSGEVDIQAMDTTSEVSYTFSVTQPESSAMPTARSEEPDFSHPDGIYNGRKMVKKSVSLKEEQNILDLITPAF